jgi:hypothetical protein
MKGNSEKRRKTKRFITQLHIVTLKKPSLNMELWNNTKLHQILESSLDIVRYIQQYYFINHGSPINSVITPDYLIITQSLIFVLPQSVALQRHNMKNRHKQQKRQAVIICLYRSKLPLDKIIKI